MALVKHEGGGRGRQRGGMAKRNEEERKGRKDVHSRGFIAIQNTDGKEKNCSRKFPKD